MTPTTPPKLSVPERDDVELLAKTLESLGWRNGADFGLEEYTMIDTYIFDAIFDDMFFRLNSEALKDLKESERREVLTYVKERLQNASESEILKYLKNGVECVVKRMEKRVFKLVDYENLDNNSFVYAREIKYPGRPDNIRPDITLFVNGVPLAIIEAKRTTALETEEEAVQQIRRYQQESPDLFRLVQVGIAYGKRKLILPVFPNYERKQLLIPGLPWKVEEGGEKREKIEHFLRRDVFLNVLRWYTFYRDVREGEKDKILARYNQYFAAEKALQRIESYLNGGEERNGLIWHWQGSGKSYTMAFIANKFFEKFVRRDPVVFFVVDRKDLQDQIYNQFLKGLDAEPFKSYLKKISSIEELKEEIETIKRSEYEPGVFLKRIYVVLIQKFRVDDFKEFLVELGEQYLDHLRDKHGEEYGKLAEELSSLNEEDREKKLRELGSVKKREILVIIDEAHRSQYGDLAAMMKLMFPNSMRFAFTGTPVFKREHNTFMEFAYPNKKEYYLDVYFIKDSIDDGFTLPIVYDVVQEGKHDIEEGIRILLRDEEIRSYIEGWKEILGTGEEYDMDEAMEGRAIGITKMEIRRQLDKIRVFVSNPRRLRKLADYIAERIEKDTEGFRFKAMVVAANRRSCVYLKRYLDEELSRRYGERFGDVKNWTEIVMTYDRNDTDVLLEYREDLIRRRGKRDTGEINKDIQREFKEDQNPKILIVTDMLITGFDAPILRVMYLDKPMVGHKLLQTIARVNRPYRTDVVDKKYGLVVDSVGVIRAIKESLKQYELIIEHRIARDLEENMLREARDTVEEFKNLLKEIKKELIEIGEINEEMAIDVDEIKRLLKGAREEKREIIESMDGKCKLIAAYWDREEVHKIIINMRDAVHLYRAMGANPESVNYSDDMEVIATIYGRILYYIKGDRLPQEFWDGLIELIHQKTVVDDFKKILSTEFTGAALARTMELLRKSRERKKPVPSHRVADAYRILRMLLEADLSNPVYREIHERIERKRIEWIERNADIDDFISTLEQATEDLERYRKEIATRPMVDRIAETVAMLISRNFGKGQNYAFKLTNLRNILRTMEGTPKLTNDKIKKIRTALLKDLFREVRKEIKVSLQDLKRFADTITMEYIVEELKKSRVSGEAG